MGKFSEGNFSLLLNKDDYLLLIKTYGLFEYEKTDKKKDLEVNQILREKMLEGYKDVLGNYVFNSLWKRLNLIEQKRIR